MIEQTPTLHALSRLLIWPDPGKRLSQGASDACDSLPAMSTPELIELANTLDRPAGFPDLDAEAPEWRTERRSLLVVMCCLVMWDYSDQDMAPTQIPVEAVTTWSNS